MSERRPSASRNRMIVRIRPPPDAEPLIIDAEFRPLSPARRLWRRLRGRWWPLGPYLVYCAVLWGLAALAGWLMATRRM